MPRPPSPRRGLELPDDGLGPVEALMIRDPDGHALLMAKRRL